jgi:hypothetical protein
VTGIVTGNAMLFDIRPSRLVRGAVVSLHGLALLAVALAALPWTVQAILAAGVVASWVGWPRPHALRLRADPDGVLQVGVDADGWIAYRLEGASHVTPLFCALVLRPINPGRRQRHLILPDSLSTEAFRRLRVWLRHRGMHVA